MSYPGAQYPGSDVPETTSVVDATIAVTGVSVTSAIGTVIAMGDALTAASGNAVTTAIGTVVVLADALTVVTGVSVVSAVSDALGLGDALTVTSGVEATAAVGDVIAIAGVDGTIAVDGVEAIAAVGDVLATGTDVALPTILGAGASLPESGGVLIHRELRGDLLLRQARRPATVRVTGIAARTSIGQVTATGNGHARVSGVQAEARGTTVVAVGRRNLTWEQLVVLAEAA